MRFTERSAEQQFAVHLLLSASIRQAHVVSDA